MPNTFVGNEILFQFCSPEQGSTQTENFESSNGLPYEARAKLLKREFNSQQHIASLVNVMLNSSHSSRVLRVLLPVFFFDNSDSFSSRFLIPPVPW